MKIELLKRIWCWFNAPPSTPAGLAARAMVFLLGFAIIYALGWREHTTILSGTPTTEAIGHSTSATLGVVYICAYLGAVVVAPILLLASALLAALHRCLYKQPTLPKP
jgi:hypothetical protein